jgi:YD repeat-containing protein
MKKSVAILLVLVVLQCGLGGTAMAQSGNSCQTSFVVSFSGLIPTGWNCVGWGYFVFLSICTVPNTTCAPAASPREVCPWCPSGGKPISLATGNTYIEQTDLRIPGLSNGLTLARTWISQWPSSQMASQVGSFGPNWRSTYEERVFLGSDGYIRYARGDASFWSFAAGGTGWAVVAPGNAGATLTQGLTYWTLTLKSGERRYFDINSGSLTAIVDRNGNTTQLSYDGLNRLATVTDPASRHLNFTYTSQTSFLVASVAADVGLTLAYTYDSQNRLSQITKPDQTTLTFQYDSNSNITAVLDSNGKVLESHTYDSYGRGLTSSQAAGVNAVTIAYPH